VRVRFVAVEAQVDGTSADSIFFKRNSQKDKQMADLKTKLCVLAGVALTCTSAAFGQATLAGTPVTATAGFIRAEGRTEKLPPLTVNVTGAVVGSVSLQVYIAPGLTITSQSTTGNNPTSETTATANGNGGTANGTVSGSSVIFNNIATTATTTTITIDNIRVDASALAVASGVPTGVTEQIFLNGANATPGVAAPYTVAYALSGVGPVKATNVATGNTICAGAAASTLQFDVTFAENFAKSFKTFTEEKGSSTINPTSGTRVAVNFANVPANVKLYVPLSISSDGVGTAKLIVSPTAKVTSETDNSNDAKAAGTSGALTTLGAVTIANGAGTAYYEVNASTSASALETFTVPVSFAVDPGAIAAPTTAVTAQVSLAPVGASGNVPNFVNAASSTTVNGSTFAACSTYLMFPYVTNAAGFETGIAISNTSLDNFGAKGVSSAATQAGTCALNFYGNATASSNPAAFTTASIAGGTVLPFTLTSAAGANFTGYMIANCNFQYAHGFAYIVYNFGTSSGAAMGYVASPFNTTGTGSRTLTGNNAEVLGN